MFNNTRVFPARLYGRRAGLKAQAVSQRNPAAREFLHGRIEVFLTRQLHPEPNEWECLVRPGRDWGGEQLFLGDHDDLQAEVIGRGELGERSASDPPLGRLRAGLTAKSALGWDTHDYYLKPKITLCPSRGGEDFFGLVEKIGHVPLPPYIGRADSHNDRERYQTVYARERGSVAAPTAGLHFTPQILERIRERGIETAEITLHVGLGTFQPVRVERVEEHQLHSEAYSISAEAATKINRVRRASRGASSPSGRPRADAGACRPARSGDVQAGRGEANLFIYPGYNFQIG